MNSEAIIFKKTKELYGGLSNMASGFPLLINGVSILTSEALYQACRFPHLPDIQERIIKEKSPMSAKMVTKPYLSQSRTDWDKVRVNVMRWCLRIKLAQNFIEFGKLLESTFNKPIVEDSHRDNFWGAIRDKKDSNILSGGNVLGRLLMELRQRYNQERYSLDLFYIKPLEIPNFHILGEPIKVVDEREHFILYLVKKFDCSLLLSWNASSDISHEDNSMLKNSHIQFLPTELKSESKIIPLRQKKSDIIKRKENVKDSDILLFR